MTSNYFDGRDCSASVYVNRRGREKIGMQVSGQFAARVIIGEIEAVHHLQAVLERALSEVPEPIGIP